MLKTRKNQKELGTWLKNCFNEKKFRIKLIDFLIPISVTTYFLWHALKRLNF